MRQDAQSTVQIRSIPGGAEVYFDDVLKGKTPLQILSVAPGPHRLMVKLAGYFDYPTTIQVKPGKDESITITLTKPAILDVRANVSQADVFVEEIQYGRTPMATELQPGEVRVRVSKSGYRDYETKVMLREGAREQINAELAPILPTGSIQVITNPPDADVYLDGQLVGRSPKRLSSVVKGTHYVAVKRTGYQDEQRTVEVSGGQLVTVRIEFPASPLAVRQAELEIEVDPPAASLKLDGRSIESPGGKVSVNVRPGRHIIEASLKGYDAAEMTTDLLPGETRRIPLKLVVSTGSNLVYYLVGGAAAIFGGYLVYKKIVRPPPPPTPGDRFGQPPAFPSDK
jgi:hypothetical protein